jgi:hypothetical protein
MVSTAMELLLIAIIGGIFLAVVLFRLILVVTFRAVDNFIDWLVYTFGSDDAVRRRTDERSNRESTKRS